MTTPKTQLEIWFSCGCIRKGWMPEGKKPEARKGDLRHCDWHGETTVHRVVIMPPEIDTNWMLDE